MYGVRKKETNTNLFDVNLYDVVLTLRYHDFSNGHPQHLWDMISYNELYSEKSMNRSFFGLLNHIILWYTFHFSHTIE